MAFSSDLGVCVKPVHKMNVTLDNGFTKSKEKGFQLTPEARLLLENLMHSSGGDQIKVSEVLDRKLDATNRMIQELSQNMDSIPDAEFNRRLQQLRNEHYETLNMCHHMQSQASERQTSSLYGEALSMSRSVPKSPSNISRYLSDARSLSSKPPIGRVSGAPRQPIRYQAVADTRGAWEEMSSRSVGRSVSLDDCYRTTGDDYASDQERSDRCQQRRQHHSRSRVGTRVGRDVDRQIQELWDRVSVDESALQPSVVRCAKSQGNLRHRAHSASMERPRPNSHSPVDMVNRWRHRVTVPEPFDMTLRAEELSKSTRPKSRSMQMIEQEKAEKEQEELAELKKQFRANPVPAHVFMPKFKDITERQAARRALIKQYSQDILKAVEKPFKFYRREEGKKAQKQLELAVKQSQDNDGTSGRNRRRRTLSGKRPLTSYHGERVTTVPRGHQIPRQTLEPGREISRRRDEALDREMKRRMRSEKLLMTASIPPGMEERERLRREKEGKMLRQRANYSDGSDSNEPDDTENSTPRRLVELQQDGAEQHEIDRHTQTKSDWCNDLDIAKLGTNNSALLRESYIRDRREELEKLEREKAVAAKQKRQRSLELARSLKAKIVDDKSPTDDDVAEGRRKASGPTNPFEESRLTAYQRELEEMQTRVRARPLLIERQSLAFARRLAERRQLEEEEREDRERLERHFRGGGWAETGSSMSTDSQSVGRRAAGKHREDYDPSYHFGDCFSEDDYDY